MKYKAIFLFSVLLMVNSVYSQFDEQELSDQFNTSKYAEHLKNDASTFLNVSAGLIKSPFQFDKNDLLLTSSILGLTAATFPMDEPLRKVSLQSQSKILDNISYVTEKFGDPKIGFAFGGMLYGGGLIFGNEDIRETIQERNIEKLYIHEKDKNNYDLYIEKLLGTILSDPLISTMVKSKTAYDSIMNIARSLFESPKADIIQRYKNVILKLLSRSN